MSETYRLDMVRRTERFLNYLVALRVNGSTNPPPPIADSDPLDPMIPEDGICQVCDKLRGQASGRWSISEHYVGCKYCLRDRIIPDSEERAAFLKHSATSLKMLQVKKEARSQTEKYDEILKALYGLRKEVLQLRADLASRGGPSHTSELNYYKVLWNGPGIDATSEQIRAHVATRLDIAPQELPPEWRKRIGRFCCGHELESAFGNRFLELFELGAPSLISQASGLVIPSVVLDRWTTPPQEVIEGEFENAPAEWKDIEWTWYSAAHPCEYAELLHASLNHPQLTEEDASRYGWPH